MKTKIDLMGLAILYFILYFFIWKNKSKRERILYTLMYLYISAVIYFTLIPTVNIFNLQTRNMDFLDTVNLIPFIDLIRNRPSARYEIIMNILMFLPFGFLYPLIRKKEIRLIESISTSFLFSLTIESLQLLGVYLNSEAPRIFDVTDLITNTLGGIFGYLIYRLSKKIYNNLIKR